MTKEHSHSIESPLDIIPQASSEPKNDSSAIRLSLNPVPFLNCHPLSSVPFSRLMAQFLNGLSHHSALSSHSKPMSKTQTPAMFLRQMQEATFSSSVLIWQRQYFQACGLLGSVCCALVEGEMMRPRRTHSPSQLPSECRRTHDFSVVPVSKDCNISSPEWHEEFFSYPFMILVANSQETATEGTITNEIVSTCKATCLFNLGLTYHLAAMREGLNSTDLLRKACVFYGHAWTRLRNFMDDLIDGDGSTKFLLMAICTNLAKCYYHLGHWNASHESMASLDELLKYSSIDDNGLTIGLHDFFIMKSAIGTGFFAAGAA